ncbi:alpha/beta fold hydrolase [Amycolatopsis sp. GM8]|uniref:alpha/beta fold hydrolase n=1 Tax=Amycolatopsis sp. GM8 TaxID=2896530 RepID=UPI001F355AEA|nr:alpha/beta hydrolase [Amycolatopsis sp. GM8]
MTLIEPAVKRIPAAGVEVVAEDYQVDTPRGTVVFLHGGGQTRHSWKGSAGRLARSGWHTLSLDARGHGDSGWAPDGDYSVDALVADLAAVVARLGEDGGIPPVLVGASMGGLTSLVAVGEGRVAARALVLVDVAPRIEPAGAERISAFMHRHTDGFATLEDVAAAVSDYNPHRARPASLDGLRKNVRQAEDGRWYWHWDPAFIQRPTEGDVRTIGDEVRMRDAARHIRIPTLLVRGVQSDVLTEDGVRDFLSLVPHARAVDVTGTGHMVAGDDNDVFSAEVGRFLDTV